MARSTSAMVGLIDIRVHSLRVKWVRSSTFMMLRKRSARYNKKERGMGRLFRNEVDTPETSVRVRSRKGHVRVGKVVARDDMGQPAAQQGARTEGPIPVTKDTLHDEHGPVVGRLPPDTLDGDGEVDGVHRVVSDPDFGTDKLGGGVGLAAEGDGVGGHGEGGKVLFGELDEGFVLDGTGTDQGHSVGSVVFGNVGLEVRLGDRVDVFLGTEDGVPKRGACIVLASLCATRLDAPWKATECKWSKTTSSYCFSTSSCSLRMTSRSLSIADSSSLEFWRMSERMSTAWGTSLSNALA